MTAADMAPFDHMTNKWECRWQEYRKHFDTFLPARQSASRSIVRVLANRDGPTVTFDEVDAAWSYEGGSQCELTNQYLPGAVLAPVIMGLKAVEENEDLEMFVPGGGMRVTR